MKQKKKSKKVTLDALNRAIDDAISELGLDVAFDWDEDLDGQLVIYTGLMERGGEILPYVSSDEEE